MASEPQHETWVQVDLAAIENNVRVATRGTRARIMAVLKANAYGHGAVPVARAALGAGAAWCGVARLDEALELRHSGLDCPILVLGPVPAGRLQQAVSEGISLTVFTQDHVEAAAAAGRAAGTEARLHLKVDTGMARLGLDPQEAGPLARTIQAATGARLEGMSTHFARADEEDTEPTAHQLAQFDELLQAMDSVGLRPAWVHAANSAATATRSGAHFDLVRLGVAVYGLHPSAVCKLPDSYRPALSWKTRLVQVRRLPPDRGVSYGHVYRTQAEERVGTALVGYADGFRRVPKNVNEVLIGGRRAPIRGRVCMDQCVAGISHVSGEVGVGDEVVLIGAQGDERISAEAVARRWGTINYDVTSGIMARVDRRMKDEL